MTDMPEDWAIERAIRLEQEEAGDRIVVSSLECVKASEGSYFKTIALARYIQSHEQPPEPDSEAWRPALQAWANGAGCAGPGTIFDDIDKARIRGLIAASKVMPK